MESCKVLWIVFGLCIKCAVSELSLEDVSLTIETCRPRGLRVSIRDTCGIEIVSFHANINKLLSSISVGQIAESLRKQGKEWVYKDPTIELRPGDKIHYWLFIQQGKHGYRFDDRVYEVKECNSNNKNHGNVETSTTEAANPSDELRFDLKKCENMLVNVTVKLYESQKEADSLEETITILKDLLKKHAETCTTLTLDGPLPNDNDLFIMVQDIITEKLGLRIKIVSVTRNEDGRADFQVGTLDDKIAIIKASKEKLKNSRFSILY